MKQKLKKIFYKSRRWLAALLCVILCTQAVEPLGATISALAGSEDGHIELLDAPGVDPELFENMDLYVEQRGEIFALDMEFTVAGNVQLTEEETTEEATTEEVTTEETTTEEVTTEEVTTEEAAADEATTEEAATEETTADGGTTEEATTGGATTEETTADGGTTEGTTAGGATTGEDTTQTGSGEAATETTATVEDTEGTGSEEAAETTASTEGSAESGSTSKPEPEISSSDLEVEKIIHEMEENYAEPETQDIELLTQAAQELHFEIDFTDAFYLLEAAGDNNVLNEEGKPIGSFELSENGDKITLTADFELPENRTEALSGSLHFSLGNTGGKEGDVKLLWDEEAEAVDVEVETSWLGSLLERFSLRDMKDSQPGEPEEVPETSKTMEFDLMKQLPSAATKMYDSLKLTMIVPRASADGTESTEIKIWIDSVVKQKYLSDELGVVEDDILNWLDEAPANAAQGIDGWLKIADHVEDMPDLKFTMDFADTEDDPKTKDKNEKLEFGVLTDKSTADIMINGEKYGTYTLTRDNTEKKVTMTCELSKRLYGMRNVTFGAGFSLNAIKDLSERELPVFGMSDGKISCTGTMLHFLDSEPSNDKPYTLKKKIAKNSADTPYVTFEVEVDSYENLAGMYIVDELPADLQLCGLRLKCDSGPDNELGASEYTLEGNKIKYRFPAGSTAKKAVLTVETVLTAEKLFAMTNGSNDAAQTAKFTNKAHMENSDGSKVPNTDAEVSGSKKFQVFQKSGKQNEKDGTLLDWTIDIDVSFKGSVDVYLVDSLDPATHGYIENSQMTVQTGTMSDGAFVADAGDPAKIDIVQATPTVPNIGYSAVTAEQLNTITGNDKSKAYFYKSAENENVMTLNLGNYIGTNGKHLQIKYSTRIAGLTNIGGDDVKREFRNYADLRWKALYWGNGPAGEVKLDYTINKPATATVNVATKEAGAYDGRSQVQTWNFDVNFYGMKYEDLVIVEDLSASPDQKIPAADSADWHCEITKVHKGTNFHTGAIPAGPTTLDPDGKTTPYYIKTGQKVEIHLGNVMEGDYFTVGFNTKVGGAAVTGNITDYKLKNEAKVYTKEILVDNAKAISSIKEIDNTLLTKEALKAGGGISNGTVNGYNPATQELLWQIAINPNSLHIKEGVITDTLPAAASKSGEHNTFGRITKVTYGEASITNENIDEYTGESGKETTAAAGGIRIKIDKTSESTEMKFSIVNESGTAADITKPLTIEFTTKLDPASVAELALDSRVKGGIFKETYKNVACLDGKIVNGVDSTETSINPATAKDEASHMVAIEQLEKWGKYGEEGVGIIKWTADINEAGANIGSMTLQDELAPKLEYKKDSLILEKITEFNADGTAKTKVTIDADTLKTTYAYAEKITEGGTDKPGFTMTFPAGDKAAYHIEFETYIVEDAKPEELKNHLDLMKADGSKLSSNEAESGLKEEFFTDQYATGTKVPLLVLEKVSSSIDDTGKHQIKLDDVEFKIYQFKKAGSGWGTEVEVKTKITNDKGRKLFVDAAQGDIYRIHEATPPAGYTAMKDKFVYFKTEEDKGKGEGISAKTDAELKTAIVNAVKGTHSGATADDIILIDTLYKRLILENTPDENADGKVTFTKKNDQDGLIEGVKYQLTHSKNLVKMQEQTSGADGVVTFEHVDPNIRTKDGVEVTNGHYILTEVSAPAQYSISPVKYTVDVKDNGTYTIKGEGAADTGSGTVLTDKLAAVSLNITKQDRETKTALAGATFTLSGIDWLDRSVSKTVASDAAGKITFSDIPVVKDGEYYTLKEVKADATDGYPAGYYQETPMEYRVYVTAEGNKAKLEIKHGDGSAIAAGDTDIKFTASAAGKAAACTIYNTPIKGTISFTKNGKLRDSDSTGVPLKGAKFGLFRKGTTNTAEANAAATATSGDGGKVTFSNVFYGDYFIKELTAPVGYVLSTKTVEIPRSALTIVGDKKSFTYTMTAENENVLLNHTAKAGAVQIVKTDQNAEVIAGVTFKVERYGTTADTPSDVADTDLAAYPITGSTPSDGTVTTGVHGAADLKELVYGTYRLTETGAPSDLILTNVPPIYLKVGMETDGSTVVRMYDTRPDNMSPTDMSGGTVITMVSGKYTLPITNELKYGLIQLNKVAATKEVTGADTVYSISATGGKANTIQNAKFEIYQAKDVTGGGNLNAGAVPYLTLKTNDKGQFDYITTEGDDKYSYVDVTKADNNKVKLLLGEYYIREIETPSGYLLDNTLYPFTLAADNYTHIGSSDSADGYKWISNTGAATVKLNNAEIPDADRGKYFVNEIVRAEVSLDKVKKDGSTVDGTTKLDNAIFIIYTDEPAPKAVASLKWDDTTQKYLLSHDNPLSGDITFTAGNAQEIPYVVLNTVTNKYELVSGHYFVDEAKTPAGYVKETDSSANGFEGRKKHPFEVDSATPVVISNGTTTSGDKVFTNTLGRATVTVKKTIDLNGSNADCVTAAQKNPNGFKFTLTKVTTDSGIEYPLYESNNIATVSGGTADAPGTPGTAGTATFGDVPYGTYTLTEEADSREGYILMAPLKIQVSQEGVRILSDMTGRTDVTYNTADGTVDVKNSLVNADITGMKYGSSGTDYGEKKTKLAGATFALYSDSGCSTQLCEADAPTDEDGKFSFSKIPYGTYYVKEKTAPAGYAVSDAVATVTIGQSGTDVVIPENTFINTVKKSTPELVKTDATTGGPVSGAVFSIYGGDTAGAAKDQIVAYLVESSVTPGTYVLSNQADGRTVADYTGATGLSCLLHKSADNRYYLADGDYYYEETVTPEYYQENTASAAFTVDGTADGDVLTLTAITNTRELTEVGFWKVDNKNGITDAAGNFVPYGIAGIEFKLYRDVACQEADYVQTAVSTGDDPSDTVTGNVIFKNLLPGTYYFKETAVPSMGGKPMYFYGSSIYTFTVDEDVADGIQPAVITQAAGTADAYENIGNDANPDLEVSLTMDLKSNGGKPLANARFKLYRNGVLYAEVTTDAVGFVDFGKVLPAEYTLVQDTSVEDYIPVTDPIIQTVADPADTGIFTYHIPVINEKPKSEDSGSGHKGSQSPDTSVSDKTWEEAQTTAAVQTPVRVVPDVIPSDMVLDKDIEEIKQFFENLDENLTLADAARKEEWHKEFSNNGDKWRQKFDMTEEEWAEWMAETFHSDSRLLPKTGGLLGSLLLLLLGAGLLGYGGYETFGRGIRTCINKKKKK